MQVKYKNFTYEYIKPENAMADIKKLYPLYQLQFFNEFLKIPEFKQYFFSIYESYDDYRKNKNFCRNCNGKTQNRVYCTKCYRLPEIQEEIAKRVKKTKFDRYGDENYCNIEKQKETVRKTYNVENVSQIPSVSARIREARKNQEALKPVKESKKPKPTEEPIKESNTKPKAENPIIQAPIKLSNSEIKNFIFNSINTQNKILNAKNIIENLDLDIFLPDANLAIEFNGLMYHSQGLSNHEKFNTPNYPKNYHLNKLKLCESKNIKLFHIFEGEDLDLWLSMINNRLKTNNRIFARQTVVREVPNREVSEFLNYNHIQGFAPSRINLGLYYKNKLVSIMTFSRPRFNRNYEYELIRFCSLRNTSVIGGATKLFKTFIKYYKPKNVISYANRRFSQGEIYKKMGFTLKGESEPNYFYFKPGSVCLESRNKYQRHKLKGMYENGILEYYNENESEKAIMLKNGYRRIFDCGNLVFEWYE